MKRLFDMVSSLVGLMIMSPVLLVFMFFVWIQDFRFPFYVTPCVDRYGKNFGMVKLRSMIADADKSGVNSTVAGDMHITGVGHLIRWYKLYEFTQLWNVLMGQMSLVGPRPALYNQDDLIKLRTSKGIDKIIPGITGWAQVNGRDELPIPIKVEFDEYYLKNKSLFFDFKILLKTFIKVLKSEGVSH